MIGEIKRHIRDDGMIKVSRSLKELAVRVNEIKKEYMIKGKEIKVVEISKKLNVGIDDIILALESQNCVDSIEAKVYTDNSESGGVSILDKISNNIDEEEIAINKILIKKMLDKLEDRDKQIIMLRYFKEQTQTQVAKILRNNTSTGIKN